LLSSFVNVSRQAIETIAIKGYRKDLAAQRSLGILPD
jgi:hypothetical protein